MPKGHSNPNTLALTLQTPTVSVVVPCYNHSQFLLETLRSITQQTFQNIEVIIVDDGSIDNSAEVAQAFCFHDPRFRLISQKNKGLSAARNTGISQARGEYVLPWDADDLFDPTFITKAIACIEQSPKVGFVTCYVVAFGVGSGEWTASKNGGVENFLFRNNNVACALMRKTVWEQVGGYDERMRFGFEDWEFWIRVTALGWECVVIPEKLFYYRQHNESMLTRSLPHLPDVVAYIVQQNQGVFQRHVVAAITQREQKIADLQEALQKESSLKYQIRKRIKNWLSKTKLIHLLPRVGILKH